MLVARTCGWSSQTTFFGKWRFCKSDRVNPAFHRDVTTFIASSAGGSGFM
jgi:hypothetical protein